MKKGKDPEDEWTNKVKICRKEEDLEQKTKENEEYAKIGKRIMGEGRRRKWAGNREELKVGWRREVKKV